MATFPLSLLNLLTAHLEHVHWFVPAMKTTKGPQHTKTQGIMTKILVHVVHNILCTRFEPYANMNVS